MFAAATITMTASAPATDHRPMRAELQKTLRYRAANSAESAAVATSARHMAQPVTKLASSSKAWRASAGRAARLGEEGGALGVRERPPRARRARPRPARPASIPARGSRRRPARERSLTPCAGMPRRRAHRAHERAGLAPDAGGRPANETDAEPCGVSTMRPYPQGRPYRVTTASRLRRRACRSHHDRLTAISR